MPLRIVLMGTGEFAVPSFRAIMESAHRVVGVLTQPDRTGRGHHQHVNVVKELALQHGILVYQPDRVNAPEMLDTLRSLNADLFLVAAYGQILRPELLSIPRLGAFNLHGSLLPRHRGAAPVQYSILKGDKRTGVTLFRIEPALDSGPMAGKVETDIGDEETAGELMLRLADLCVPMTLEAIQKLADGTAVFERQDESCVTFAPKIRKEAGSINWALSRREIDCHVRAMQPWPRASAILVRDNQPLLRCLILHVDMAPDVQPDGSGSAPGDMRQYEGRLFAATGDGWLEIVRIQPEGRKAVDGRAFVNGHSLQSGDRFE